MPERGQIDGIVKDFNTDAAARRAFAASCANGYTNGLPMPSTTVTIVADVMARRTEPHDAIDFIRNLMGIAVPGAEGDPFGADGGRTRPGQREERAR